MALSLNTEKAAKSLTLSLHKKGFNTPPSVELAFLMDVSSSFEKEHEANITTEILERLIPWGMVFDPDKKLDFFAFSHTVNYIGDINEKNYSTFMRDHVIHKTPNFNGGTSYAPALKATIDLFSAHTEDIKVEQKRNDFFGKLFNLKEEKIVQSIQVPQRKGLTIVLTDGETQDKKECREVLLNAQKEGIDTYFLFLGFVQNGRKSDFDFIKELGDEFDNTAFYEINDFNEFKKLSDEDLNEALIQDELITWFNK